MSDERLYLLWARLSQTARRVLAANYLIQCYPLVEEKEQQRLEFLEEYFNYELLDIFQPLYSDNAALADNFSVVDYFINSNFLRNMLSCKNFKMLNFKGTGLTMDELEKIHEFIRLIESVQMIVF